MKQSKSLMGADSQLEAVFPLVENLLMEDKIKLLERILGGHSSLIVTLIHPQSIHCQIDRMNREELGDVLRAVSVQLARLP